jgi:V/A-type H+-transporting ATPase subunit K
MDIRIIFIAAMMVAVAIPVIGAAVKIKMGLPVNRKRFVSANLATFAATFVVCVLVTGMTAFAEGGESVAAVADSAEGIKAIAAALVMGLACIGSGIAIASSAPAALGAASERPEMFGKAIVIVALGEGIAIFGLLALVMILSM